MSAYHAVPFSKLSEVIQEEKFSIRHDHESNPMSVAAIVKTGFELVEHLPYSPTKKNHLHGRRLSAVNDVL